MKHWKKTTLRQVGKWGSGGTPLSSKPEYYNGSIPWLVIEDLNDGIVTKSSRTITQLGLEDSSAQLVPPGTLLIAMYGSIGKLGITGVQCATNQAIAFCQCDPGIVSVDFLFFYLLYSRKQLLREGKGVTQSNISQAILKEFPILLPPLPEQKRIADILAKVDRLRRLRRTARDLSNTYLQSVFLEMFGDPVSNPMGWDLVALGNVCVEIYRYPTFYGFKYTEKGVPVARIGNILSGGFLDPNRSAYVFIEPEISENFPRTVLELHDIVMAVRGDGSTATRIGLVNSLNLVGANISPNLLRFKVDESVLNPLYLFNLMTCDGGQKLLGRHVTRTAKKTITARDIKRTKIPLPPLSFQEQFAHIVHKFERLRAQQREALRQAEHLFQTLLHRAFRGKL